MAASSCGEVSACWIRVPTENIKQKMQAGMYKNTGDCLRGIARAGRGYKGFYKGYVGMIQCVPSRRGQGGVLSESGIFVRVWKSDVTYHMTLACLRCDCASMMQHTCTAACRLLVGAILWHDSFLCARRRGVAAARHQGRHTLMARGSFGALPPCALYRSRTKSANLIDSHPN